MTSSRQSRRARAWQGAHAHPSARGARSRRGRRQPTAGPIYERDGDGNFITDAAGSPGRGRRLPRRVRAGRDASGSTKLGQPAALSWYHDHYVGDTRMNVVAGLAAGYLIRDGFDTRHQSAAARGRSAATSCRSSSRIASSTPTARCSTPSRTPTAAAPGSASTSATDARQRQDLAGPRRRAGRLPVPACSTAATRGSST